MFGEPWLIDQNQFWTHFWRTMVNRSEPVVDPFFGEPWLIDWNQLLTHFSRTMVSRSEPVVDPFLRTMVMNPKEPL
jgi:hypothetical protein